MSGVQLLHLIESKTVPIFLSHFSNSPRTIFFASLQTNWAFVTLVVERSELAKPGGWPGEGACSICNGHLNSWTLDCSVITQSILVGPKTDPNGLKFSDDKAKKRVCPNRKIRLRGSCMSLILTQSNTREYRFPLKLSGDCTKR